MNKRKQPSSTCGTTPRTRCHSTKHVRRLPNGGKSKPGRLYKGELCLLCEKVGGGKQTCEEKNAETRRYKTKKRRDQGIEEKLLLVH